jgi:acyl-coenzyme A thioesterase PaaI-like protein
VTTEVAGGGGEAAGSRADSTDKFRQMGFLEFLGIEVKGGGVGFSVIGLDPKPAHLNHNGDVNAAVLFGIAEVAGAGAVVGAMLDLVADKYVVVKKATIEYVGRARGYVTATGRIDPETFADAKQSVIAGEAVDVEAPVEITDAAQTAVCRCTFLVTIRPRRSA